MLITVWLLGLTAEAKTDARMLEAIAAVESGNSRHAIGDGGKAIGRFQMHPAAWQDANDRLAAEGYKTYPRSRWRDPVAQDMIAHAYLRILRDRLATAGVAKPSPAQLALCWNLGFTGAKAYGFDPDQAPANRRDYARRVENIFLVQGL
jgi:hypothetical protein